MKKALLVSTLLMMCAMLVIADVPQLINYQGYLTDTEGNPLDDAWVNITFRLYGDAAGGEPLWEENQPEIYVQDGLFNVVLGSNIPIPDRFDLDEVWLGVQVDYDSEMLPRTRFVSVPYAYRVGTVDGASGGTITSDVNIQNRLNVGLGNTNTGPFAFVAGENNTVSGDHGTVSGGASNQATNQFATVGGGNDNSASGDYSVIGGGHANISSGVRSVVAGGYANRATSPGAFVGGGAYNYAYADSATVCGGTRNEAGNRAFVGGGVLNTASGWFSTIGGGAGNSAIGDNSFIGGGLYNSASHNSATIGGGWSNSASGTYSVVGGGTWNTASNWDATVGGGWGNTASGRFATVGGGLHDTASGENASVGGGSNNSAIFDCSVVAGGCNNHTDGENSAVGGGSNNIAAGLASTVPGGMDNLAEGDYSVAMGRQAKAVHNGSFVWADSYDKGFSSSARDQFNVRASGGTQIYSNSGLTAGVTLAAGGSAWAAVSDSTKKRNLRLVDTKLILDKVSQLPIKQWSYISQDPSIEHIGPTAQDFWKLFHVGDDSLTISTIDPSGIALAAIQELQKENQELRGEVNELRSLVLKLAAQQSNGNNPAQAETSMFIPETTKQNTRETQ